MDVIACVERDDDSKAVFTKLRMMFNTSQWDGAGHFGTRCDNAAKLLVP